MMKKSLWIGFWKRDMMRRSIRNKILIAILVVTLFSTIMITVIFYFKSANMIEENYARNLHGRVMQMTESMDRALKEIYYMNSKAAVDKRLIRSIESYETTGNEKKLDSIASMLRSYQEQYEDLKAVYLLSIKERIFITSEDYPVIKRNLSDSIISSIKNVSVSSDQPILMKDPVHNLNEQLFFIQEVRGKDGTCIGYLLMRTEERMLYYKYLEPVYEEEVEEAMILDQNNRIISAKDYKSVGKYYDGNLKTDRTTESVVRKGKEILIYERGVFSNCSLYMTVKQEDVLKELNEMQLFLIEILIAVFFLAVLFACSIAKTIYEPVKKLAMAIDEVSGGNLDTRVEVTTKDEIGTLSREFNAMLDYIEDLIQRVVREEEAKKDAELEALQYQITPHFMYNTLNSIKFAALMKGEKELGQLLGEFVELLQATANKKGTFLTVNDEIHILKNYIHLQEFRYQGSFQVEYEIDEKAGMCLIPRLLLQPLVENALLHGMDLKEEKGKLLIQAYVEQNVLHIYIKDNGRGMTKEQIQQLLQEKTRKKSGLSAIGVPNIKERLSLYYGTQGGLFYESDKSGTTAHIFLPISES